MGGAEEFDGDNDVSQQLLTVEGTIYRPLDKGCPSFGSPLMTSQSWTGETSHVLPKIDLSNPTRQLHLCHRHKINVINYLCSTYNGIY